MNLRTATGDSKLSTYHKRIEVVVVVESNTAQNEWTVMVHVHNTLFTYFTMVCSVCFHALAFQTYLRIVFQVRTGREQVQRNSYFYFLNNKSMLYQIVAQ